MKIGFSSKFLIHRTMQKAETWGFLYVFPVVYKDSKNSVHEPYNPYSPYGTYRTLVVDLLQNNFYFYTVSIYRIMDCI